MLADEAAVESLLLDWYSEFQRGHQVALEEICRDRPDLLARVEARVVAVRRMEKAIRDLGGETSHHAPGEAARSTSSVDETGFDYTTLLKPKADDSELGRLGGFRVVRLLGRGGMGAVFLAEDSRARRLVALKVMRPDRSELPEARLRFLREARAAAALTHDHLMPVFEVNEDGRIPYIVMPFFDGETLASRLTRGSLTVPELLRTGRHIALGLAAAHGKGILHRDLKPSNIWLERLTDPDDDIAWRARVMDFGLALDMQEAERLTASGIRVGTPEYMSPEQADDGELDARSDLFSLGVVLHEAATGRSLFARHKNLVAILNAIVTEPTPDAPLRAAGLSPRLIALMIRLLAKQPNARPATASEVVAEFRAIERDLRL